MSDGGKGSSPRPLSVDLETFDNNWDKIFNKNKWDHYSDLPNPNHYDNERNDFQDILSTEDCMLEGFEERNKKNK